MEIKVEIISRETIRPSSPTPDHLKTFDLSIFDQFMPAIYTPVVLFYTKTGPGFDATVSHRLKSSLSNNLTRLYPFAGRIKDNICVDCNDDGVEFLEARVFGNNIMDILARPDPDVLSHFLPVEMKSSEAYTGSLVLVQANFFENGGLAIGISLSHKLVDAATMNMFINSWAHFARDGPTELAPPDFTAASVFPPSEMLTSKMPHGLEAPKVENTSTRRFVFDSIKVAALRVKSASEVVTRPTRVEAVCALLWKCRMKLVTDPMKTSVVSQAVNLRKRINPPLPEDSVGNVLGLYYARADRSDEEDLPSLVAKLRKSIEEYAREYASKLRGPDGFSMICTDNKETAELLMVKDTIGLFMFTSWCRLGLYEADFGWGKPDWTSCSRVSVKNTALLMDSEDGKGIEAWVTLLDEEMELFKHDQELLSFASSDSYY